MIAKTLTAVAVLLAAASPAAAAVAQILLPDAAYTGSTTLLPITEAQGDTFTSVTDGTVTATFGLELVSLIAPGDWSTWSSPPETEGTPLPVGWTQGLTSLTITLSQVVNTFGFEAQPNPFDVFPFTVEYFLGGVSQGSISRNIDGTGGARLLAATGTGFDSVTVTSDVDFALANFRYAVAEVPAPAAVALFGLGIAALGLRRRAA